MKPKDSIHPIDPIIDLYSKTAGVDLLKTLKKNGFAILKNHEVSLHLLKNLYTEWSAFFKSNKKFECLRNEHDDEGYIPINTENAVGYERADHKEFYQSHINGRYPDFIDTNATKKLVDQLVFLGEDLINLIHKALPQKIIDGMITTLSEMVKNSKKHGFRVIHYPAINEKKSSARAEAHSDICLLTILPNATSKGLELQGNDGIWHSPEISNDDILVFNADMLEMCTNAYLKSTIHRVNASLKPKKKPARYSFPIFIHPKRETELQPNITALDALRKRLSEIGYNGQLLEK